MWLGTARAGSWDDGGAHYSHQLDSMEILCKALWGHHTGLAVATVIPTVVTEKGIMTKALAKKFPGVGEVSAAAIVSLVAAEVALMSQQVEEDDTTS